jgi:hypothetical protein
MKTYIELGLAALLAVVIYEKPSFLLKIVNSTLGKAILIVTIGIIAKQFGINAGLLAAVIFIVLQETTREGLSDATSIGKASSKNIGCNKKGCIIDRDCTACSKAFPKKINPDGTPKQCNCKSSCKDGTCKCNCVSNIISANEAENHAPAEKERFQSSGTDQIGLGRQLKINALERKNAAAQQANGFTNNGGGLAY